MLQAALNGSRAGGSHAALPIGAVALAADARACVAAGARSIHVHPRDATGRESMDPAVVDSTVRAIRDSVRVPIGVSTGAWIEPDLRRRIAAISGWREPDMASVNLHEDGAADVMRALSAAGIAIEAGIWSVADVDRLERTGLAAGVARLLIEVVLEVDDPVGEAERIHAALDRLELPCPRLLHGERASAWPVLRRAQELGMDTRIGLEDTLELPDGSEAPGNEALVRAALAAPA